MPLKFPTSKKPLFAALFLSLTLLLGISIGYFTNHVFSENAKFENFTEKVFAEEVSGSTLTLHYSLAYPEKLGVARPSPTLGTVSSDMTEICRLCQEYEDTLKSFSYSKLSKENQLTLDLLLLHFHTEKSLGSQSLLREFLGPSLGVQAQLPILLAEYAFYEDQDITDYLNLLTCIRPYFQSILAFEQEKSEAGLFMSDAALDRILEQCSAFIQDPDSNYMQEIFEQKLEAFGKLSEEDQEKLLAGHKKLLNEQVIPAYQELMSGLEALRGTGKSSRGLVHFTGGREYYQYLIQSETGSYVPVKKIEERLLGQLLTDSKEISAILAGDTSLLAKLSDQTIFSDMEPEAILETLREKTGEDFPSLAETSYELRYVHESMEEYLSPAFYLTPPLDICSPNVIYLNRSNGAAGLELFTTLAHEGFPGHLYQTVYFQSQKPNCIRSLISSAGYAEGWATYIESYAYQYAASLSSDPDAASVARLSWLNRSITLNIYSLLDIGIHYHGWNEKNTATFLSSFGIRSEDAVKEIFQYIVETPANYLKYYWGYLNFLDLKNAVMNQQGENFDLKAFHEAVLKIGPVPFPILEKYIKQEFFTAE